MDWYPSHLERSVSQRSQPFAHGVFGKLSYAVYVQLLHNLTSVRFNSLCTYVQVQSNLFCGLAFGDELKHLAFPAREGQ